VLTPEDLKPAALDRSETIDILAFVPTGAIDAPMSPVDPNRSLRIDPRLVVAFGLCALAACSSTSLPAGPVDASTRVPRIHRPAGSICPSARGAGMICDDGSTISANPCAVDSDCAAGTNGRCFSPNGPGGLHCTPTFCSYDGCQSDADCPAKVPCECRASAQDSSPNSCVTGGNCATDSDCGPGGTCSPGAFMDFCAVPVYFCHTAGDTCIDDSDCPPKPNGPIVTQTCNYDSQANHFACGDVCLVPP